MNAPSPALAPRISCILPTRGRPEYLRRAIEYFRRQTWSERELIIIYDHPEDLPPQLEEADDLRLIRAVGDVSIGAKRNLGVEAATGALVAQWDDDDWHGCDRLRAQAAPIVAGTADVTALTGTTFFELETWRFWRCSPELHARMFVEDVSGGTLVYRRDFFSGGARYPHTSLREDADFLGVIMARGARLARVQAVPHYLYLRHVDNTWRFRSGEFMSVDDWVEVPEPAELAGDRGFYLERAADPEPAPRARPRGPGPALPREPLVACIMPTADRPDFVPRAIRYFLGQTYGRRSLLVLDDGRVPVGAEIPSDPRIRYVRAEPGATLGEKRNLACSMTEGEVILHWDDDDWMAPRWIEAQVEALLSHDADVVGLRDLYFYEAARRRAWRYTYPRGLKPWVAGATLAYRRAFWERNPFPAMAVGEDVRFLWNRTDYRLVSHDRRDLFVATVHARNTERRALTGSRWARCLPEVVERLFIEGERAVGEAEGDGWDEAGAGARQELAAPHRASR